MCGAGCAVVLMQRPHDQQGACLQALLVMMEQSCLRRGVMGQFSELAVWLLYGMSWWGSLAWALHRCSVWVKPYSFKSVLALFLSKRRSSSC